MHPYIVPVCVRAHDLRPDAHSHRNRCIYHTHLQVIVAIDMPAPFRVRLTEPVEG